MLRAVAGSQDLNQSVSRFPPMGDGPDCTGGAGALNGVCHVQVSLNRNLTIKIVIPSSGPSHLVSTFQIICH